MKRYLFILVLIFSVMILVAYAIADDVDMTPSRSASSAGDHRNEFINHGFYFSTVPVMIYASINFSEGDYHPLGDVFLTAKKKINFPFELIRNGMLKRLFEMDLKGLPDSVSVDRFVWQEESDCIFKIMTNSLKVKESDLSSMHLDGWDLTSQLSIYAYYIDNLPPGLPMQLIASSDVSVDGLPITKKLFPKAKKGKKLQIKKFTFTYKYKKPFIEWYVSIIKQLSKKFYAVSFYGDLSSLAEKHFSKALSMSNSSTIK